MGPGPRGYQFFVATPLSLPENEGNAHFRTIILQVSKKLLAKVIQKITFMNQGHSFTLVKISSRQFVAVTGGAGGTNDSKGQKIECEQ